MLRLERTRPRALGGGARPLACLRDPDVRAQLHPERGHGLRGPAPHAPRRARSRLWYPADRHRLLRASRRRNALERCARAADDRPLDVAAAGGTHAGHLGVGLGVGHYRHAPCGAHHRRRAHLPLGHRPPALQVRGKEDRRYRQHRRGGGGGRGQGGREDTPSPAQNCALRAWRATPSARKGNRIGLEGVRWRVPDEGCVFYFFTAHLKRLDDPFSQPPALIGGPEPAQTPNRHADAHTHMLPVVTRQAYKTTPTGRGTNTSRLLGC
mmetsp:Transcript_35506/g.75841  ORF Transcript_35506/g.75841 Transcript_35506/m.75841 type:complete len:267 (-) Transcript_35506:34-834(-)